MDTFSVGFGLLGALFAYGFMIASGMASADPWALRFGVGLAPFFAAASAWGVQHLRMPGRWARARWALVVIAGAILGMCVQAVQLREPVSYAGPTVGLTKLHPVEWVLAGAPAGAAPSLVAMLLLLVCLEIHGRVPPLDIRERMLLPVAGVALVLAAGLAGYASTAELPIVLGIGLLAAGTLIQIVVRDTLRARWLVQAFRGVGPFTVVSLDEVLHARDLPAYFGGRPLRAAVVRAHEGTSSYRTSARVPIARTARWEALALAPVRTRRKLAATFVAVAVGVFVLRVVAW